MMEYKFIEMIEKYIDDLRSGIMPKNKFISIYISELMKIDKTNAFRYKNPQVIGYGIEPNNNWLTYILELHNDEYICFRNTLKI